VRRTQNDVAAKVATAERLYRAQGTRSQHLGHFVSHDSRSLQPIPALGGDPQKCPLRIVSASSNAMRR